MSGCAFSHLPQPFASLPVQSSADLGVMTFNLRVRTRLDGHNIWDRRRDLVVERIRKHDPDLLGTQEGLESMEAFLSEHLPDYTFFGAGRETGEPKGEMCGVFYRTARFDLLEKGYFWLSDKPDTPGSKSWGSSVPRVVVWLKLRQRDDGHILCWFNTHFDYRSAHARAESAKLLLQRIHRIAGPLPCILTGDFNCGPRSASHQTLVTKQEPDSQSLHDVFRIAHPLAARGEGTFHFFTGVHWGPRIDWILATSQFHVVESEIDHYRGPHGYPSDHFPVTAVLRWETPSISD